MLVKLCAFAFRSKFYENEFRFFCQMIFNRFEMNCFRNNGTNWL